MNEDLFILTFLKSEIDSARFGQKIFDKIKSLGVNKDLILDPDLNDINQNNLRRQILDSYRKYSTREDLFEHFPLDINWQEEVWTTEDLLKSNYIDYSYWNELSSGTRSPIAAAENIKQGQEACGVSNKPFLKFQSQESIINFENIILVKQEPSSNKSVIVEGHSRITIYAVTPKIRPDKLRVLVGYSKNIQNWDCF